MINPKLDISYIDNLMREVGQVALMSRFTDVVGRRKDDGSIVTDADLAAQHKITAGLLQKWPDIPLLGEEMSHAQQQKLLNTGTCWVLDPLDGTSNFAAGTPYFSISLALVVKHQIIFGMVFDPERKENYWALQGGGAWVNGECLKLDDNIKLIGDCIAMVDLKRLDFALVQRLLKNPPYQSQRYFGSVALEWCWLAHGRAQLYLHGGQKLWDYAAGWLIFKEAGGCTAMQTEPLSLEPRVAVAAVSEDLLRQWILHL